MQPDFMYHGGAAGEVDVISAYTSDGQIAQYDLVVLDDPKHAIPPYDAVLLLAPQRAHDETLIAALTAADRRDSGRAHARGQLRGVERQGGWPSEAATLRWGSRLKTVAAAPL